MSDVKWIKLSIDMFENRKIRHLRKLPDGNNIVLIWVMLLSLAGKCNAGGMIFLTENIPYTPKMLADELDFEENTVILALDALERFGMIRRDGFLVIEDWDSHQNAEGLDKIREQTRKRVARYRENQKALQSHGEEERNATCNDTVTQSNAPRIRNREEDIEEDTPLKGGVGGKEKKKKETPKKTDYTKAEFEQDLSVLSKTMADSVVEWLKYKKQRKEAYKPVSIKKFITQVKGYADQYGEEAVITVISDSIANGYMGVAFASIKKKQGGTPADRRKAEYDYDADTEGVL